MIYLVLYAFEVCFGYLVVFVYIRKYYILSTFGSHFDYLIDYNDFVKNSVYFFVLVIFLYNLSYMVIDSLCNWCCSEEIGVVYDIVCF